MIFLYIPMALTSLFFSILTWVFAPLLALTIGKDNNLPKYLYWFQTFDNDFITGPQSVGWEPSYLNSVRWLWRNPAYGFDLFLLGVSSEGWTVYKDTPTAYVAMNWKRLAFCYRGTYFHWGWKAWAISNPAFSKYGKMPIVVLK